LVTVVVPTLAGGDALADCLRSLDSQTFDRFDVVVVDNSGEGRAEGPVKAHSQRARVLSNPKNVGFGTAINQGFQESEAPYVAALNDDATADPHWLELLYSAAEAQPRAGMWASEVLLAKGKLDSAGMLISIDGSSKQRGHGNPPDDFAQKKEALLPSGSAALYRRKMLEEVGPFDETFFLYCEDTDLGLRARWAGWECAYVPGAIVEHRYSQSAGRASMLKAYYVERNRLFLAIKNFPLARLALVPFASVARYFWHLVFLMSGQGKTAEFRETGHSALLLPFLVLRAHASALFHLPALLRERRRIRATRKITPHEFEALLDRHSIPLRQVASL